MRPRLAKSEPKEPQKGLNCPVLACIFNGMCGLQRKPKRVGYPCFVSISNCMLDLRAVLVQLRRCFVHFLRASHSHFCPSAMVQRKVGSIPGCELSNSSIRRLWVIARSGSERRTHSRDRGSHVSLVPQCFQRINLRRPPYRCPARQQPNSHKQSSHHNQRRGVAGLHFKQERLQHP
jgi:hypothetical protein